MLSAEEWWSIIEAYGSRIWPVSLISWAVTVGVLFFLFVRPGTASNLLMKIYLVFWFAWIGIVFFMILGKGLVGNYIFGSLFIIVSILFAADIFREKMQFRLPELKWRRYVTLGLMLVVLCYPLFGMAFGHHFPRLIIPGTYPCPTTAIGLLLLTMALPRVDKIVYIVLLFWAIVFPPFIQIPKYGVYEDGIMFLVGLYALVMLGREWKTHKAPNEDTQPMSW